MLRRAARVLPQPISIQTAVVAREVRIWQSFVILFGKFITRPANTLSPVTYETTRLYY
ncbi:hypothetical protein IF2G_08856 [Cordyceps javanica]|nr:hypothetical protein IF2G_08856 [Cordyceps javanica]